ncbi:MAG TPA: phosphodiester glycosidase family protein [Dongiaceae bacterium]|nr:phosphodiester glycosidase family protein [Dongiaceae bacterium]
MPRHDRRIPIGRLTVLAAAVVAAILLSRSVGAPHFHALRPGMEFAVLRGDPYCRMGLSEIAVLRLDPRRVRVRMGHYTQYADPVPLDIMEWERRTGALAVFNAGQYYPDYSYMGLFVSGGRVISGTPHPEFKAALVADPKSGGPRARVLDLDAHPIRADELPWREVAQSFRLFDDSGHIRVRKSNQVAYRTAVGEDAQGRLLVIATEGGYTLYELAGLLRTLPLGLRRAMSMDGGEEAALVIHCGTFNYASFGHRTREGSVPNPMRPTVPLPAVVTVMAP